MILEFLMTALPIHSTHVHVGLHEVNPVWGMAAGVLGLAMAAANTPLWVTVTVPFVASATAISIAIINRKADAVVLKRQLRAEMEANHYLRREIQKLRAMSERIEGESD
jgi:hypothetical protein